MNKYKVIIVGEGPGGLACANELKELGEEVLIIEKNAEVGSKICAGGSRKKELKRLGVPEKDYGYTLTIPNLYFYLRFPPEILVPLSVIDREKLGRHQERLLGNSVHIRKNCRLREINIKEKSALIQTSEGREDFLFDYLVGADGSNSIVRKELGLENNDERILITLQYCLGRSEEDITGRTYENLLKCKTIEMFSSKKLKIKELHPFYGWIFPHDDFFSVGVGHYKDYMKGSKLKEILNEFVTKINLKISDDKRPESFPINCDYQGYCFGNIFLVGDAGGFADLSCGEGIYQALETGKYTGRMIYKKIMGKDYSSEERALERIVREKEIYEKGVIKYLEKLRNLKSYK